MCLNETYSEVHVCKLLSDTFPASQANKNVFV
jgi:hypothetical protein